MPTAQPEMSQGAASAAGTPAPCRLLLGILFGYFILLSVALKLLEYYSFEAYTFDTGVYANVVYNLFTDGSFYSDILRRSHLGEHFSPIIALFVPFYAIEPSATWLLAVQGLAGGIASILMYVFGRSLFRGCGGWAAWALPVGLALLTFGYPPLSSAIRFEFHPSTLGVPLLIGALLALRQDRGWLAGLLVGLLFLTKENAPLAVLGAGLYALLVLSRPRAGALLALAAGLVGVALLLVVMPLFRDEAWRHYDRLGPWSLWEAKATYLFHLLSGLAFLPLLHWRSLVAALPLLLLNLSVQYQPQFSSQYHYDDLLSVFLLVSAAHGAGRLLALCRTRLASHWARLPALAALAAAGVLACLGSLGLWDELRRAWPSAQEWRLFHELQPFQATPDPIAIAADGTLGPHLALRERFWALGTWEGWEGMLDRMAPGDLVLQTPLHLPKVFQAQRAVLDADPRFEVIHDSEVLRVYRRLPVLGAS